MAVGIPRFPAQVRRAPVLVLRTVLAGVGRLLMLADRPVPVTVLAPEAPSAPDLADGGDATGPQSAAAAVAVEASRAAALPLPNYDGLSLASIRARLRGLDVAQLKVLLDYEAANAERTEVLGMFERRIEKLEAGP
jgi:hypothetical protein